MSWAHLAAGTQGTERNERIESPEGTTSAGLPPPSRGPPAVSGSGQLKDLTQTGAVSFSSSRSRVRVGSSLMPGPIVLARVMVLM
jgi:hypothetical protein